MGMGRWLQGYGAPVGVKQFSAASPPSWPPAFDPQQYTVLPVATAQVCDAPVDSARYARAPTTRTGTEEELRTVSPI